MQRLEVIAFAGAFNWPLWAGQRLGLFAYAMLIPEGGLTWSLAIDLARVGRVIALRNRQGRPLGPLAVPAPYVEDSFRCGALA